jgi:hypothetical protein
MNLLIKLFSPLSGRNCQQTTRHRLRQNTPNQHALYCVEPTLDSESAGNVGQITFLLQPDFSITGPLLGK